MKSSTTETCIIANCDILRQLCLPVHSWFLLVNGIIKVLAESQVLCWIRAKGSLTVENSTVGQRPPQCPFYHH